VTILSVASDYSTVVLTDVADIIEGDVLYVSSTIFAQIDDIDRTTNTLTLKQKSKFTAGAASILNGYTCTLKWAPFFGSSPMTLKHFREMTFIFSRSYTRADIVTVSDLSRTTQSQSIEGSFVGAWGLFPWGGVPWGGEIGAKVVRMYIPRQHQRSGQISISFSQSAGYNFFSLNGVQILYNEIGNVVAKEG
jgi:hypothetical protein